MRSIREASDRAESVRLRLTFLALLLVALFVLLLARLWFLQVMAGEQFVAQATGNAVRTVTLDPPRGKMVDRDGDPLVRNRITPVVAVRPDEMGQERQRIYTELAQLLNMDRAEVVERAQSPRYGPFRPRPIATDVPVDVVSYIHTHTATRYPGVTVETKPRREYPHGTLAAHALGYVGQISSQDLEKDRYDGYQRGAVIGWSGVERARERWLRGTPGQRRLEVDPSGDVVRQLGRTAPTPGSDLQLTLDVETQRMVEQALADGMRVARQSEEDLPATAGAAVVMDPRDGSILAMASRPTFDPSHFVGGIGLERWRELNNPDNHYPLINRAVQSAQPPGSVFKVVTSLAALDEGIVTPSTTLDCPSVWEWNGFSYPNWQSADAGPVDLTEALAQSCNTYYFELARRMWNIEQSQGEDPRQLIQSHAKNLGLGQPTGVGLPSERGGTVPGREWKRQYWERTRETTCAQAETARANNRDNAELLTELCRSGYRWRGGDAVNLAIGQGDLLVTPLQMANVYAAIANGGTLPTPHLTQAAEAPDGEVTDLTPEPAAQLDYARADLAAIHRGLVAVNERGTASAVFADMPVTVAGKTGTAQNEPKEDISWYVGYAPAENPRYVVAVMVAQGGGGGQTAAPITRHIFEGLLDVEQTRIDTGPDTD